MKYLCLLISFQALLFALSNIALASDTDEAALKRSYPWAVIEKDTFDLGTIKQGSTARNHITIRNEGRHDLIVAGVRSSCGLMIPNWPADPVGRNEEVVINFRYNASRLGAFERKIILHTNAYQKTIVVTVFGEVIPLNTIEESNHH
jgi:hypothetical protein